MTGSDVTSMMSLNTLKQTGNLIVRWRIMIFEFGSLCVFKILEHFGSSYLFSPAEIKMRGGGGITQKHR